MTVKVCQCLGPEKEWPSRSTSESSSIPAPQPSSIARGTGAAAVPTAFHHSAAAR